jgi:hypothetical protein
MKQSIVVKLNGRRSTMSNREKAFALLDEVPEFKIDCVIAYIQGIIAGAGTEEPNDETIAAMRELEAGGGESFDSLDELWKDLEA